MAGKRHPATNRTAWRRVVTAAALLTRLHRVRSSGHGSWMASCPGPLHRRGDRNPSLHITEASDGAILLRCFGGCEVREIVAAVGLELSDLFPQRTSHRHTPTSHRAMKSEVFDLIMHEGGVIWLIGCDMH